MEPNKADPFENPDEEILLVKEPHNPNGDNRVKAVSGIDKKGNLKTVEPKKKNSPAFMKVKGNVMESFFENFLRQAKNPTNFLFFKVPNKGTEENAAFIDEQLKHKDSPNSKRFIDLTKIDLDKYQQKTQQMETEQQTTSTYKPIDETKVDWAQFEKLGVSRETLEKTNSLEQMLNYGKSPRLFEVKAVAGETTIRTQARLSMRQNDQGLVVPVVHAVRMEPQLDRPEVNLDDLILPNYDDNEEQEEEDPEVVAKRERLAAIKKLIEYDKGKYLERYFRFNMRSSRLYPTDIEDKYEFAWCGPWAADAILTIYKYDITAYGSQTAESLEKYSDNIWNGMYNCVSYTKSNMEKALKDESDSKISIKKVNNNSWEVYWNIAIGLPSLKLILLSDLSSYHWSIIYGSKRDKNWWGGDTYWHAEMDNGSICEYYLTLDTPKYSKTQWCSTYYLVKY